jgi:hypothetical protein
VQLEGADEAARQLDRLEQRVQRARQGTGAGGAVGAGATAAGPVTRAVQSTAAAEAVAARQVVASRSSLFDTFGRSAFGPAIAGLGVGLASLPLQQLTQSALQANRQVGAFDPARARIDIERQTALSRFGRSAEAFQQPLDRFGTSLLNAAGPAGGLVAGAAAIGQGVSGIASIGAVVAGLGAVAAALGANTAATTANTVARSAGGGFGGGGGGGGGTPTTGTPGPGGGARGAVWAAVAAAGRLLPYAPALAGLALGGDDPRTQRLEAQQRALARFQDVAPQPSAEQVAGASETIASIRAIQRSDRISGTPGFLAFDLQRREQALLPEAVQAFDQARLGQAQGLSQIAGQRRALALQQDMDALSARQFDDRQGEERRQLLVGWSRAAEQIGIGAGRQGREAGIGAAISRREIGIGAAQQLADIQRSTAISQREITIGAGETRADIEQGYQRGRRNLILGQIGGLAGGLIGLRTQRRDALADLEESVGRQRARVERGAGDATEGVGIGAGRALAGAERSFADQLDAIARSRGDAEADLTRQTTQQIEDVKIRQTQEQTLFTQAAALRQREQTALSAQITIQEGLVKKLQPSVDDQITAYDKLTTSLKDMSTFLDRELVARGGRPTPPAPSTQATAGAMPNY